MLLYPHVLNSVRDGPVPTVLQPVHGEGRGCSLPQAVVAHAEASGSVPTQSDRSGRRLSAAAAIAAPN